MNKRLAFVAITTATILLSTVITSCGEETVDDTKKNRMVRISTEREGSIVYDRETGVEYWRSDGPYNAGTLTVLLNEDGKPLIFERN